jgi:hypothetical protein
MLEIWEIVLLSIASVGAVGLFVVICGPVLYACFCADNTPQPPSAEGQMLMAQIHLWSVGGVQHFYSVYGRMPTREEISEAWRFGDAEQQARLLPYLAQYGIDPRTIPPKPAGPRITIFS